MMVSVGNKVAKVAPFQRQSPTLLGKDDIKMEPEATFDPDNPGYQLVPLRHCLLCGTIFQSKGLLHYHFRTKHPGVPVGPELLEEDDENDDEESYEDENEVQEEEGDDMEEADEEEDVKPDVDEYYYPSEIFRQNPYETSTLFKKTNEWVARNLKEVDLWPHYKIDDEACSDLVAEYRLKRREAAKKPVDSSEDEDNEEKPSKSTIKKRNPRKKSTAAAVKRKRTKAAEAPKAKKKADNCHDVTPELLELGESVRVQLFRGDFHFCNMCLKTFYSKESYVSHSHDITPEEADRLMRENPWSIRLDRCDDLALAYTRSRGTALSCDHCDHIAKNATELRRHQRFCKPEYGPSGSSPSAGSSQQVNCDHCGLIVKSKVGLRRHTPYCRVLKERCQKSSTRNPPLKCNRCGSTMKNLAGLRRHKRSCSSGRSS